MPRPLSLVGAVLAALLLGALVGALLSRRRAAADAPGAEPVPADAWFDGLLVGWLGMVAVATLTPLSRFGMLAGTPEVVLTPLERLAGAPGIYALVNVLLLAPVGLLLVLRGARARIGAAIACGTAVSFTVEVLQLAHPDRVTNVDDLVLNTAGVVAGALLGAVLRPSLTRSRRRRAPADRPPPDR
ncbi:VanZ family protein [Egicoccus halophilus]|uniref:VanZ-like domain-containing protein n=1 Tax=Egicoccus halophilus TaxID=1670830 RepID=A0A8J3A7T5_9ACTN|nr:VanZ family protein [Egicoccus halophilus]GGI03299.1 hypothetical protein GCM10011354_03340 [Egicoccus halophilus]